MDGIEEKKLRAKIAEWLGFRWIPSVHELYGCWQRPDGSLITHDGLATFADSRDRYLPDFLHDFNACLEHIVPKLREKGWTFALTQSSPDENNKFFAELFYKKGWVEILADRMSKSEAITFPRHIQTSDEVAPIAFCLAVEKIIDMEEQK